MNVYDFDKTIYAGDSATHFFLWCVRRYPSAFFSLFPAGWEALRRGGPGIHGRMKEKIYGFLRVVPRPEEEAAAFWDAHMAGIYPWYLRRKRADDVIISASPSFLVGEACRRLEVACLATEMDTATGRLLTPNCRGEEKIRRFRQRYGNASIQEFYSDSFADRPLMELAERSYLMKKGAPAARIR